MNLLIREINQFIHSFLHYVAIHYLWSDTKETKMAMQPANIASL